MRGKDNVAARVPALDLESKFFVKIKNARLDLKLLNLSDDEKKNISISLLNVE